MANTFTVSRTQLIFAVCLPLAVLVGYFLAEPTDMGSLVMVGLVLGLLAVPVLIRCIHPLLIFSWNAAIVPYFLPGQPQLWMLLALSGLMFAVLNRISNPEAQFIIVPSIHRSLIFLAGVIAVTAMLRGGIGMRMLGSSHVNGKGYVFLAAAIAGYFALASRRLPARHAGLWVAVFFLSGLTGLIPNLAYMAGSWAVFLFYIFPPNMAMEQARADYALNAEYTRFYGLTITSLSLFCWLLARYGLRGLCHWSKPWRLVLLGLTIAGCLFCGFRSLVGMFALMLAAQLYLEGLCRPRVLVGLGVGVLLAAVLVLPNAAKLPPVVQRTLSFLPVEISPGIRQEAEFSSQWRFQMWHELLPQVPQYLLKGKGYGVEPGELTFAAENESRGYAKTAAFAIMCGEYHNGPLTVVIPFGLWGVIGFVWFLAAALKYLYANYRSGDPALRTINTFLLACFAARVVFYFFIFGSFYHDLFLFTGLAGLSVSLNGVRQPAEAAEPGPEVEEAGFHEELVQE